MKRDKIIKIFLEMFFIMILFFALFAPNIITRSKLALLMFLYMFIVACFMKKRKISSINKRQVTILMVIFSGIYLGTFYLLGLYFGFVKSAILFSLKTIFKFIIPIFIIIFSSEIIRRLFLSSELIIKFKTKKIDLSLIFTYISMVIIDLLVYADIYNITRLDNVLTTLGFVFFASLSCNLLYNYITCRYGSKGVIVFRLITVLFVYIIPIVPDIFIFFRTFLRMLYPYLIYLIFEKLFSKNDYTIGRRERKKEIVSNTILILISALLVMVISCKFKYGIIVVGSESMSGFLDKGDAVIFEKYDGQDIHNGSVIIFDYNNIRTIHRVVDIKKVNGEYRYYTKGDANLRNDDYYRISSDIYGVVDYRVKHIGYPTLWIRDIFSNK